MIVRLKGLLEAKRKGNYLEFQFYDSPIKS